jgi:hypothetical protein
MLESGRIVIFRGHSDRYSMNDKNRFVVRVPVALREAVERQAERDDRTVSDIIRECLQRYAGVKNSHRAIRRRGSVAS